MRADVGTANRSFQTEWPNLEHEPRPPAGTLKLSACQTSTSNWNLDASLDEVGRAGIEGVSLYRPKLVSIEPRRVVERVRCRGQFVSSIGWLGGFVEQGAGEIASAVYDALDSLPLAAMLGCRTLNVSLGGCRGFTPRHARRIATDAIRRIAWHAHEFGVRLALDAACPIAEAKRPLAESPHRLYEMCADIDAPNVHMLLRTSQFRRVSSFRHFLAEFETGDGGPSSISVRLDHGDRISDHAIAGIYECLLGADFCGAVEVETSRNGEGVPRSESRKLERWRRIYDAVIGQKRETSRHVE
ncbi:sugar phosphate isomerase/epimerase family protein [Stratiformator vulcanicus]|uniref:Xylose isomerase-like TIM barrel n=1 Tax=Stratiformator vulcanicus TaxID=2527980 RepID=A0A517R3Q5_9PLAN|nr:TIM barrel protein [Stratiformator vulcanicus]QDT38463.1 Xylose isomerase-like TIM barrel [Stratiformator vulcanicus]